MLLPGNKAQKVTPMYHQPEMQTWGKKKTSTVAVAQGFIVIACSQTGSRLL